MLVTACSTGRSAGEGLSARRDHSSAPRDSSESGPLEWDVADGNPEEAVFAKLPTDFAPVQVSDPELSGALTTFWLDAPLRVATPRLTLCVGCRLALTSVSMSGEAWQPGLEYGEEF